MSRDHDALLQAARIRWPGRHIAGLAACVGGPTATIAGWLSGRRNPPAWALERLAKHLKGDGQVLCGLGEEIGFLAGQAARRPRKARGWQVVKIRDASGIPRDGRWRGGRKPAKK